MTELLTFNNIYIILVQKLLEGSKECIDVLMGMSNRQKIYSYLRKKKALENDSCLLAFGYKNYKRELYESFDRC